MSLKEIGNGTLSQNRHCDALVDERELQTSSSRVMAQRCVDLSLSLCVCVFLSSLCVRDRYLLVARGGRVILFLYLRLEKKKSPTKTQKTRRLIGWGKNFAHAHCAHCCLSFVLSCTHKHQTTTDHLKRVLSLPSFATDNNQGSRSRVTRRSQQAGQSTTPRENKTR